MYTHSMMALLHPPFVEKLNYASLKLTTLLKRYPGPTLKALELIQQEQFRKDILRPDVVERLTNEWMNAFTEPRE